jgi:uncharacterized repeat protein (TIGR03806 family)
MRPALALTLLALAGCGAPSTPDGGAAPPDAGGPDAGPRLPDGGRPALEVPGTLSELGLFKAVPIVDGVVQPADDTFPYELSTALFSDYALKTRTLRIPEGTAAWSDREVLAFPIGTIITKTFSFPADLRAPTKAIRVIETRLLVHQPTGWEAYAYLWDDAQREASYVPGGRLLDVSFIGLDGGTVATPYLVPSKNQCQECHHLKRAGSEQELVPIGPKARYLNVDRQVNGVAVNQLEALAQAGKLVGLPPVAQRPRAIRAFVPTDGTLEERARTLLDVNCAHCHRAEGTAGETSQLFLDFFTTDRFHLGECKRPGSAGNDVGGTFDILPGSHAGSILWFRLQTTESGKMMPALGRALRHDEGADLVAAWIDSLPPRDCGGP